MVMVERALGGSRARKLRAVLPDLGLKGEKAVATEVMYLASIFAECVQVELAAAGEIECLVEGRARR